MNNPFDYEPSAQMLEAQHKLMAHIEAMCNADASFAADVSRGKMFGILRAKKKDSLSPVLLYAFSGQIGGSFSWEGFVPPVFDYLDEDGYFKVHEREITSLNHRITEIEESEHLATAKQELAAVIKKAENDINDYKRLLKESKARRDACRKDASADDAELIRESQFQKAELHRRKLFWREQTAEATEKVDAIEADIRLMKLQRQQKSDHLQRWLFEQFVFKKTDGTHINLIDMFRNSQSLPHRGLVGGLPPSGSGECCEPKLLRYALENNLEPEEIGMFWWGESPKQEIRHHLQFYPACSGKCRVIIENLALSLALPIGEGTLKNDSFDEKGALKMVFEDDYLVVVNKPAGMLSVPGKGNRESVFSLLKTKYPECEELAMVHRLDMDTSGLLVVAKTKEVHKNLQRQFAEHTIEKEYEAILTKPITQPSGIINLPLRPDYNDRPRQIVDKENGKPAITKYHIQNSPPPPGEGSGERLPGERLRLSPLTGRTHQLRVHCAHPEGLGNPIRGDRLYGKRADRLYLHAASLTLTHPRTGERMTFRAEADF